jgi:hypothetical protein
MVIHRAPGLGVQPLGKLGVLRGNPHRAHPGVAVMAAPGCGTESHVLGGRVAVMVALPVGGIRDDLDGTGSCLLHCERSAGRYLFDALLRPGAGLSIMVDGFRPV